MTQTDDWITTTEASVLSGYHPERIRELARGGIIEARKFGTIWQDIWQNVKA